MEEFGIYLRNQNKSAGTIETYLLDLKCFQKWLYDSTGTTLKKLYRENIIDYISYMRNVKKNKDGSHLKAQSINVHISALIKFNKFLIEMGKQTDMAITEDDIIPVQKRGVNPCKVTQAEIREFRQNILEDESRSLNNFETKRNFCMVTFLQYLGLRKTECISIEMDDVPKEARDLTIKGKGGKERNVYLNDKCVSALKEYLKVRPENAGKYLFVTRESIGKDKIMDRSTMNKIFSKYSKVITPHQQRHAWATHALQENIYNLSELQLLAGHSSIGTTQIYLNPDIRMLMEKANQQ